VQHHRNVADKDFAVFRTERACTDHALQRRLRLALQIRELSFDIVVVEVR